MPALLKKHKAIFYHLAGWVGLFLLNFLVLSNYPIKINTVFHIKVWILYIVVFYLNYLVLMPYLMVRKKVLWYIIFVIIMLVAALFTKDQIVQSHRDDIAFARHKIKERAIQEYNEEKHRENNTEDIHESKEPQEKPPVHRPFSHPFRPMSPFSFYGIFLFYISSLSVRLLVDFRENEMKRTESEKEKITSELARLKQQVNPHFLFNSLNSIYSLANRKSEKTPEAVLKLSDILRYMIYDAEKTRVQLKQEMDNIENYISLQRLKTTKTTQISFKVSGTPSLLQIEPLIMIPLVENAFKYGVDNLHESFVKTEIEIVENNLTFMCSNKIVVKSSVNGLPEHKGIGLKNVIRRLELLYPENHELTIREENEIFTVTLKLNLKQ